MTQSIDQLTDDMIQQFWNRKPQQGKRMGRIDFVVDVDNEMYYLVPRDKDHQVFVPTLPCFRQESLVPFWMRLDKQDAIYHVRELVVGASSFEATYNIKHTPEDLAKARGLAWLLIAKSPLLSNASIERDEVLKEYCDYQRHEAQS